MTKTRTLVGFVGLVGLVAAACGGGLPARAPGGASSSGAPDPSRSARADAQWVFGQPRLDVLALELDDGERLEVGDHGERSLVGPRGRRRAPTYLPGRIAGLVATAREIGFVARDGAVHAVGRSDPLGPLGPPRRPPVALDHLAFGRTAILGSAGSSVLRSIDAGNTWSRVPMDAGERLAGSLALTRTGRGAALFFPQRSFATDDDGATWTLLAPPNGPLRRVSAEGNVVVASSAAGWLAELAAPPLRWSNGHVPVTPPPTSTTPSPPLLGYAGVVDRHEGTFAAATWLELAAGSTGFDLYAEPLESDVPPRLLHTFGSCSSRPRIAASRNGLVVVVECSGEKDTSFVHVSGDGGEHWVEERGFVVAREARDGDGIAVSDDGAFALVGVCSGEAREPCPLRTVVSVGGRRHNLLLDEAAHADAFLQEITFVRDGLVAFGTPDGDATIVLSGSRERVRTRRRWDDFVSVTDFGSDGDRVFATDRGGSAVQLFDSGDRGVTWTRHELVTPAPLDFRGSVALAGRRGFALLDGIAYETLDRGTSWSRAPAPPIDDAEIRCGDAGCFVAGPVRRVGWGAPLRPGGDAGVDVDARPRSSDVPPRNANASAPPPLRCRADGVPSPRPPLTMGDTTFDPSAKIRWSAVVYEPNGLRFEAERIEGNRVRGPVVSPAGKGEHVTSQLAPNDGAAFASFDAQCLHTCDSHVYTGSGDVTVTWIPAGTAGIGGGGGGAAGSSLPSKTVRFAPAGARQGALVNARALPDGSAVIAMTDVSFVVDTRGTVRRVDGDLFGVTNLGTSKLAATRGVVLRDLATSRPVATWMMDDESLVSYLDRGGVLASVSGSPAVWAQVQGSIAIALLAPNEIEPTRVRRVDVEAMLATGASPCSSASKDFPRVRYVFDHPWIPWLLDDAAAPNETSPLLVEEATFRVAPDGSACVGAVVAGSLPRRLRVAAWMDDLTRATVFRTTERGVSIERAACTR